MLREWLRTGSTFRVSLVMPSMGPTVATTSGPVQGGEVNMVCRDVHGSGQEQWRRKPGRNDVQDGPGRNRDRHDATTTGRNLISRPIKHPSRGAIIPGNLEAIRVETIVPEDVVGNASFLEFKRVHIRLEDV